MITPIGYAIPQKVTRFQALAALQQAGLLTSVTTIINDPGTAVMTKLAWDNASHFERQSPTLLALAQVLNLTSDQLDQLFITASGITA